MLARVVDHVRTVLGDTTIVVVAHVVVEIGRLVVGFERVEDR